MSFVISPKWFFGIIDQPGVWAISSEGPGVGVRVGNYRCSQNMDACWVAYLGQIPEITMPPSITMWDVIGYLNEDTLPPSPKNNYYADKSLADLVTKLFEADSLVDSLKAKIRARSTSTT